MRHESFHLPRVSNAKPKQLHLQLYNYIQLLQRQQLQPTQLQLQLIQEYQQQATTHIQQPTNNQQTTANNQQ